MGSAIKMFFFFQAEDGIRDYKVTGVQTCALPILANGNSAAGDSTGDFVWETSQLAPGYPASPGGQLSFVTDELSIVAQIPGGLGAGLFYWAPEWIPGVGWEPGAGVGSPNVNLTLFNFQGTALPSIGIFRDPAAVCQSYDPFDVPCVIGG